MTNTERIETTPPSETSIEAEHIWAIVQPSVEANFAETLQDLVVSHAISNNEDATKAIFDTLKKEESFVKDVSSSVFEAIGLMPDARQYAIMFDLDETTARKPEKYTGLHLMRPAMGTLLATLKVVDPRISFGVLTIRPLKYLEGELAQPSDLTSIAPFLDKELVVSARGEVVRGEQIPHYDPDAEGASQLVAMKIKVCERLLAEDPGRSILLIDDLVGLDQVQTDHRLTVLQLDSTNDFRILD